jgi:hypothetical protein
MRQYGSRAYSEPQFRQCCDTQTSMFSAQGQGPQLGHLLARIERSNCGSQYPLRDNGRQANRSQGFINVA